MTVGLRRLSRPAVHLPLRRSPHHPRINPEGVEAGRRVMVFKIAPANQERLGLLATDTVSECGWVGLPEPIIVRAGEAFVAVPEPPPR